MRTPVVIINFKTYESGTAEHAVALAKVCEQVAQEEQANIVLAVQAEDLYHIKQSVSLPVYAQHIDAEDFGSHTGSILAEAVKENGAIGTLLNHSERQLDIGVLEKSVEKAKEAELELCICADSPQMAESVAAFEPQMVAFEPPELIGGDISVSTAQPELISETVEKVKAIHPDCAVLVGAGVKNGADVAKSLELGAEGVLLASGVTKAEDPYAVLKDLCSGLKKA